MLYVNLALFFRRDRIENCICDLNSALDKIVKDENESNDDTRVKITDYRSDLTKNFFLSGEKGLSSLIEAIRKAKEQAQERE